jgi:hypothetical protein
MVIFVFEGSGIGYMVIAVLVSDFIMMHVHKSRERYRAGKVSLCEDTNDQPLTTLQ